MAVTFITMRSMRDVSSDDMFIGKPVYSPDQKYKAVMSSENGGGAISPYCFDYVSVVPADLEDKEAIKKTYRVYAGNCHTLGFSYPKDKLPSLVNAPLLKWKNSTELEITFDRKFAEQRINGFFLAAQADAGRIKIVQGQFQEP